jgi:hypothetical protein
MIEPRYSTGSAEGKAGILLHDRLRVNTFDRRCKSVTGSIKDKAEAFYTPGLI